MGTVSERWGSGTYLCVYKVEAINNSTTTIHRATTDHLATTSRDYDPDDAVDEVILHIDDNLDDMFMCIRAQRARGCEHFANPGLERMMNIANANGHLLALRERYSL